MEESKSQGLPVSQAHQEMVFRELMSFRVREVLLVSSLYDSYILRGGRLLSARASTPSTTSST